MTLKNFGTNKAGPSRAVYLGRKDKVMKNLATFVINKAQKDRSELAKQYNVSLSCVVWIGDNKYIVVKDGKEIRI